MTGFHKNSSAGELQKPWTGTGKKSAQIPGIDNDGRGQGYISQKTQPGL
jgi:hypothetical protein